MRIQKVIGFQEVEVEVYLIFKNHLPSGALINSVTQKKNKKILLSCGEPLLETIK